MCDPVSLAITAGTALLQSKLQGQAAGKINHATQAAQDKFNADLKQRRDISNANFQDSIQESGLAKDKERMDKAVIDRTAANQPTFDQRILLPGQGDASGAVKQAIVQAQDRTINKNANAAEAAAKLGAYGDANLGQNIKLGQNNNRISTQAGFVQGGLNNLQADSAAAAHAGDSKAALADMVGAIGQIGGAAYGAGAGAGLYGGYDPSTGITWDAARNLGTPVKPGTVLPKGISVV